MKKYEKLLRKLSGKSRDLVIDAMRRLRAGDTAGLDIVKIGDNLFRTRAGNYRVFFFYEKGGKIEIDDIRKRDEKTYRDV